jgi:hypothetical protein
MADALRSDALRELVREVLRETLPHDTAQPAILTSSAPENAHPAPPADDEAVVITSDDDLNTFVQRLLQLFDDPTRQAELREGRLRFRLAGSSDDEPPAAIATVVRIERGAVTETHVRDASRAGARLLLGRAAVLTPLARDRARALGLDIEKER